MHVHICLQHMAMAPRARPAASCELTRVLDSNLLAAPCEPVRVDILHVLVARSRMDVQTMAEQLPQDRSVISRHLAVLHRAGVVRREKVGRQVFFELDGSTLLGRLQGMVEGCRRIVAACCPPRANRRGS